MDPVAEPVEGARSASEFKCMRCGNCCRGDGFVRVSAREFPLIAQLLGITEEEFLRSYTRRPDLHEHAAAGDRWLLDKPANPDECVFLEGNNCRIQPCKPAHCKGFPLQWRNDNVTDYCEGMKS